MNPLSPTIAYEIKQAEQLIGGTITATVQGTDGASWGFMVQKGRERFAVFVDCDPEGNGPGHLSIQKGK